MTCPALWRRTRNLETGRAATGSSPASAHPSPFLAERRSSAHHPVEDFRMAFVRRFFIALVVGLLWAGRSSAQNPVPPTGTITGRVIDATTQQPVSDVNVVVEGTRRGAG